MIPPEAVNVEDIADTALPESTVSSARTTGTERICKPKEQRAQVEKRGRGATEAATENRAAAEAWDALPTPAPGRFRFSKTLRRSSIGEGLRLPALPATERHQ